MQRFAQEIKGPLWRKIKVIYHKYTGGADIITLQKLEALVKEVLLEESPGEIDYIVKNLHRIDTDHSGTIDFEEFANFILKRHCGEMSLQKMHRNGQIKNWSQRKITQSQFKTLLNNAYAFLDIRVDDDVIPEIFASIDQDRDGLITYPEYFGFTDLYVLEVKPLEHKKRQIETIKLGVFPPPQQPVKQFRSRFRSFLFSELRRIFALYDKDFNSLLDSEELRLLLIEIFGISPNDFYEISSKYFQPDTQGRYQSFNIFVPNFMNYASEIGWFGFSKILPKGKSNLNLEEFIKLLEITLSKLNLGRVDRQLLIRFFEKLDANRDGLVEVSQFKSWVTRFLSPHVYHGGVGSQYYVQQDDESISKGARLIKQFSLQPQYNSIRVQLSPAKSIDENQRFLNPRVVQHELKFQTRSARKPSSSRISESQYSIHSQRSRRSSRQLAIKFIFSSQDLAKRVRKQMLYLLQKLDKNHNKQFQQSQIIAALQILMKSDKQEIQYVIANVFRYDKNGDNIVTYEELANFFLEMHCGELAIQRLHKEDTYQRGAERMMNAKEFVKTVEYALSFIEVEPIQGELLTLFNEVDLNKDGWISYQEYFEFLIHYFGTQSAVAKGELRSQRKTVYAVSFNQQSPAEERFSKLIRSQTRVLVIAYDLNQNLKIQKDEARMIADEIFDQNQQEIQTMLDSVYTKGQQSFEYDYIVNKFLELHASEIILIRCLKQGVLKHGEKRMLDVDDFSVLINTAFKYLPVLPTKQHYIDTFAKISTTSRDLITFREYQHFVAKYLGKCDSRSFNTPFDKIKPETPNRSTNSRNNKDKPLVDGFSKTFREFYAKVDRSGEGMDKVVMEKFVTSVFGKENKKDIDYLLWTVFRVDQDSDGKVSFQEAIPFIFRTKAELSLNELHRNNPQINEKERLNSDEFTALMQKSFEFYDFKKQLNGVFQRLDTDRDGYISDREYLTWILGVTRSL